MQKVLIIGCGYTGIRMAVRLQEAGYSVTGTARSEARVSAMRKVGIEPVTGALDDEQTLRQLVALDPALIVYFIPPQKSGADPLAGVVDAFRQSNPEAFIYASATSVYGDRHGDWVDENSPIVDDGVADRGRIDAERLVENAAREYGLPIRICRISGIYGPERTLKGMLKSGHYKLIEGQYSWVARIHVDDLVSGFIAAWEKGENGHVYNMVDQQPHRAAEFANLAADLNELPRPEVIGEAEAREKYSEDEWRRKTSSKRIRCATLTDQLGVELKYPTFEDGLPASVAEERASRN
ncbi:MAG TPA: NAD-dependent epimerase/dehydratase family protein [Gammaproteobacteria bacterium]|jgi:nucleoside-diphosphate-sugar epimerase|nr:hypothetical protein [Chromatiales bacterium]MCP4927016.1 NAD-dependent epimerase/dehydratase family protein [Gammaproteobacteria bacterium]HJP39785.1 NAD-dependent epimerase/dehydratase family protein [Gammaproteobacteria bacterium]